MIFYAWKNYTDLVFEKLIQLQLKNDGVSKINEKDKELSEYSEERIVSDSSSSDESLTDDEEILQKEPPPENELHYPSFNNIF